MFLCFSAYDYVIESKGKMLVKTDIQIALFDGCYGRIGECRTLCYCLAVYGLCRNLLKFFLSSFHQIHVLLAKGSAPKFTVI